MNESFVASAGGAKARLVLGRFRFTIRFTTEMDPYELEVWARLLCLRLLRPVGVCQGSCRLNRHAACLYIWAEARVRSGFR
jgi:hypothetical protein